MVIHVNQPENWSSRVKGLCVWMQHILDYSPFIVNNIISDCYWWWKKWWLHDNARSKKERLSPNRKEFIDFISSCPFLPLFIEHPLRISFNVDLQNVLGKCFNSKPLDLFRPGIEEMPDPWEAIVNWRSLCIFLYIKME